MSAKLGYFLFFIVFVFIASIVLLGINTQWSNRGAAYYDEEPFRVVYVKNECPAFQNGTLYFRSALAGYTPYIIEHLDRTLGETSVLEQRAVDKNEDARVEEYRGYRKSILYLYDKEVTTPFRKYIIYLKDMCRLNIRMDARFNPVG